MTFDNYQELARRTQNEKLALPQKEQHALHGMASEVGEIHAIYQKFFQGHEMDRDKLIDELGDLLWFMAEYTDAIGTTLEEVATRNNVKLRKRYPAGFSEKCSVNRVI